MHTWLTKKLNAEKLDLAKPAHVGTVADYRFFEHPTRGDEAPLLVKLANGDWYLSSFWDVPSLDELDFEPIR